MVPKRQRVLMVTTVATTVRAFLLPLVRVLKEMDVEVDCACLGADTLQDTGLFDRTCPISISRNPFSWKNFTAPQSLTRIIGSGGYAFVHVHTPVASFVVRATRTSIPIIYTAHGFHFFEGNRWYRNLLFENLELFRRRRLSALVVINEEDYHHVRCSRRWRGTDVTFIPGIGVDFAKFSRHLVTPCHAEASARGVGVPSGGRYLLSVGELVRNKRHHDAIGAFARVFNRNVHFVIAGRGPAQKSLRALARRLGVSDRVHFAGFRSDIRELLYSASGFVFVSEREGLPVSLMEAIAMRVPCVASDVRGNRDLFKETGNLLVQVGDQAEIARQMESILARGEGVDANVDSAWRKLQTYSVTNVLNSYRALYKKYTESAGASCNDGLA